MDQLRGSCAVMLSAITEENVVPLNFGRAFNIGRTYNFSYEGGIGAVMVIEPVLNSVDATFSQGRATIFAKLLAEMGMVPRVNQFLTWEPVHLQVTDLVNKNTFVLVQKAVITAARTSINRATTISDDFNGLAQWAYFRDEIEV